MRLHLGGAGRGGCDEAEALAVERVDDRLVARGIELGAEQRDPRLLVGLTLLTAAGTVDLTDPSGQLHSFLSLAQTATAGMSDPLTADLVTQLLTP